MQYLFVFVGVFLALAALLLLTHQMSGDERAAVARIDAILSGEEQIVDEEPILLKLEQKKTWLQALIGETSVARHIDSFLNQAAWTLTFDTFLLCCLGVGFAGFVLSWMFAPNPFNELLAFCGCALIPYFILRNRRTERLKAFDKSLPNAMDIMQRTLKAGLALNEAFKRVSEKAKEPVSSEFSVVIVRMQRGADMRSELIGLAERVPSADLRIFVTAMLVQSETGGNLPLILERLTDMIRMRITLLGEMKAQTAQGRMSGIFLALIPIVLIGVLKLINPIYLDPMVHDPRGKMMLIYAVISDVFGLLIIRRITTMEV